MSKVMIVCYSGFGHTKRQAEAVCRGVASVVRINAELLTTDEACF